MRTVLPLLLLPALCPSLVLAGEPGRILHEHVPGTPHAVVGDRADARGGPLLGGQPGARAGRVLPRAILRDGLGLLAPQDGPQAGPEERIYGQKASKGEGSDTPATTVTRNDTARLDRATGKDGVLSYSATFNPSVAPFRRDAAFDWILEDESLVVSSDRPMEELQMKAQEPAADAELFWGSLVLDLSKGRLTALPSVAPQAEILAFRSTPAVALAFLRDRAGNFWVRPKEPFEGSLRLVFLSEAPQTYFGGEVPDFELGQIPPEHRARVPACVRRRAAAVLARAGVRPGRTPPREALFRLVSYFRSFAPGEAPRPRPGSSTYQDLSLARRGVCRHRSMSFVITAQSYGLPARYVHNEAHAFVEAYIPSQGWRRIDLGGASEGLDLLNALGKIPHEPRLPDPFPRPGPDADSHAAGSEQPGQPASRSMARHGAGPGPRSYSTSAAQQGSRDGSAARGPSPRGDQPLAQPRPGDDVEVVDISESSYGPEEGGGAADREPMARSFEAAGPLSFELEHGPSRAFRGESLRVSGWARDREGQGVQGAPVALVLLRRAGGPVLRTLGLLITGPEGSFRGRVPLPPDLPPGDYQIEAMDGAALLRR